MPSSNALQAMPSKQCSPSNVLQAMSSPDESCPTTRKPTKTLTPQYPSQSGWYDGKHEEGWPFVSPVTCHRGVPRACHPSQSHACLAGGCMGLARRQWWPRYGRLHTAGAWWGASQGLRARASHTDTGGSGDTRGAGAGQRRDPEKSWGGNAGLGTTREQQPGRRKETHWYWEALGKPARLMIRFLLSDF